MGRAEHNIVYDPSDGPVGAATSQTPLGECMIEFRHDAATAEPTLTVVKKPWLPPEGVLWSGFMADPPPLPGYDLGGVASRERPT